MTRKNKSSQYFKYRFKNNTNSLTRGCPSLSDIDFLKREIIIKERPFDISFAKQSSKTSKIYVYSMLGLYNLL